MNDMRVMSRAGITLVVVITLALILAILWAVH
jgi:hypothetical protein